MLNNKTKRNEDLATRERWGTSVDKDLLKEFKQLQKQTRIPMSRLLDEAIEDLLKKYDQ